MTSSASALPVGLVDQVFADLEQTGPFMQASACGCPGPQFSWEAGDWPLSGVLDLALLQASSGKPSGLAIFD